LSVSIKLHRALAKIADGQTTVEVEGESVGQCLEQLVIKFPRLKKKLFEKDGALSRILEIYLNGESIYPGDLDTRVKDGDELDALLRIAGG
jgi:molybdopterin converting factor small subunit